MKRTKHIGMRIDPELHAKMVYISEYEGRSLSGQLIYLMQQCVRGFERENGPVPPEALTDSHAQ